tara:strand:- start:2306 stop:2512 length:207 start_codon:yes stop_codon:yes gene_type:complete
MVYGFAKKVGEVGRDGLSLSAWQMKGEVPMLAQLRGGFTHPKIQEAATATRTNPFSQQFDQVANPLDG